MDKTDLELLGYCPRWSEFGFLTPEYLRTQVASFHTSDDKCTEHYRYAAFKRIQQRPTFSDRELEQYIELAAADPDPLMGRAALIDLVYHPGLTETQWEALLSHPRVQELPRLVKRERLLRELRKQPATEETFQRCVEEGDSTVHRALLDLPDLPLDLIELLHQRGSSKAVRNIAGVRLRHHRRRSQE